MGLVSGPKTLFLALALHLLMCPPAWADIYRYVDEKGVMHFTNIDKGSAYRLYIRGARRPSGKYLQKYKSIINRASERFGIETALIQAIIQAESSYDHLAVSKKGAQGLMQLMPETAKSLNVKDPFDPEENILGGTRYFSMMLKRFNYDKRLAAAAYNAGPERVDAAKGIPSIPETQQYVQRVMRFYQSYKSNP